MLVAIVPVSNVKAVPSAMTLVTGVLAVPKYTSRDVAPEPADQLISVVIPTPVAPVFGLGLLAAPGSETGTALTT